MKRFDYGACLRLLTIYTPRSPSGSKPTTRIAVAFGETKLRSLMQATRYVPIYACLGDGAYSRNRLI